MKNIFDIILFFKEQVRELDLSKFKNAFQECVGFRNIPRKEVIPASRFLPHATLLRFHLIICPTLGGWFLKVTLPTLGVINSRGVDGRWHKRLGTYLPRHADPRLAIPTSQASWAAHNLNLRMGFKRLATLASSQPAVPSIVVHVCSPGCSKR